MGDALGSSPFSYLAPGARPTGGPQLQPSMRGYNAYGMGSGPVYQQGMQGISPQLFMAALGHFMQQQQGQGVPAGGVMHPPPQGGAIADAYKQAGGIGPGGMALPTPMGGQMANVYQHAGMGLPPAAPAWGQQPGGGWKDIPQVGPPIPGFGPQAAAPGAMAGVYQANGGIGPGGMALPHPMGGQMAAVQQAGMGPRPAPAPQQNMTDLMRRYPGLYSR